jgi:hypothetical protein
MLEELVKKLSWIANNQRAANVNFRLDLVARNDRDFFHGQMVSRLFDGQTILGKTGCPKRAK